MTIDKTVESLGERLNNVERQNRQLKAILFGAVVISGIALLMGADRAKENEVKARRFVIVDDDGMERGFFGLHPSKKTEEVTYFEMDSQYGGRIRMVAGAFSAWLTLSASDKERRNQDGWAEVRTEVGKGSIQLRKGQEVLFAKP